MLLHININVKGILKQMRIPLTVADSATSQFNDTNIFSFICGFHKITYWNPKQQRRSKKGQFPDKSDFGLLRIPLAM